MGSQKRFRLYLDEAGDHTSCSSSDSPIGKRYLCLLGVVVPHGPSYSKLEEAVTAVKKAHLPYNPASPPIFHREDILYRRGPFHILQDPNKAKAFDDELIGIIDTTRMGSGSV